MAFTLGDFTAAFPEFGNATTYPPATISFWETQAYQQLDPCRFGSSLDLLAMLFVAHYITLSAQASAAAASGNGASVGQVSGPVASKAVGGVSKSLDVGATTISGGSQWNTTSYGVRFYEMLRRFSRGGIFVAGATANPALLPNYGDGLVFENN